MRKYILLLLLLLLFACQTNKINNYIQGSWVVTNVICKGESFKNGIGFSLLNFMIFDKNHSCEFPMLLKSRIEAKAEWKVYKKKSNFYLNISNCVESFYNGDYLIIQQKGTQKKMILRSTTLELNCSSVQFGSAPNGAF
jgi:hypothetical protein